MEPTQAINALEVAFRELIRLVWGADWITKSQVDVPKLEGKLRDEQAKRRGATVSTDLLDYTEFTQLGQILLENWSVFAPALGKKKYAEVYIDRLNGLRNAPMHSRVLLPFERDLLSGIVGELVNLLAIYRSQKDREMQYYPVIDSIVDSFGNDCGLKPMVETNLRLKVGDKVTFACRATDPQGRALTWDLSILQSMAVNRTVATAGGTTVRMEWTVEERDVSEDVKAIFVMASDGKYHRSHTIDDRRIFMYAVDPPD